MKAGFVSLGCSKILIDTEVMLGILQENNFELTNEPAEADVLIVNTCAFIQSVMVVISVEVFLKMLDWNLLVQKT